MIGPLDARFRGEVNDHVRSEWGGPAIVSKGRVHDISGAEGFVCVRNGRLAGYLLYCMEEGQCEVLVLQSFEENKGVGTALLRAVIERAREAGAIRVWLVTTNDNIHAIRYYQRFGFELVDVRIGAMEEARRLKPGIPLLGQEGIPLAHEFVFQFSFAG